jgi:hypothetical protein
MYAHASIVVVDMYAHANIVVPVDMCALFALVVGQGHGLR